MSDHFIKKCSCGAVITQCRCMSKDKTVTIIPNGCPECKHKSSPGENNTRSN